MFAIRKIKLKKISANFHCLNNELIEANAYPHRSDYWVCSQYFSNHLFVLRIRTLRDAAHSLASFLSYYTMATQSSPLGVS